MSGPVYPEKSTTATTELGTDSDSRADNSLVNSTFDEDPSKFFDLTLSIPHGAKKEEETRFRDKTKEASAAEKESSDWKETTDDPSDSFSNDTDLKPEEAHGARETTEEGIEVSAKMGPLMALKAGLSKMYEIGKQLIEKLKVLASFGPHRTAEAEPDKPPSEPQSKPFQLTTDSRTERGSASIPRRHNSKAEKEKPESSKSAGFQDSLTHNYVTSPHVKTTPVMTDYFDLLPDEIILLIFKQLGVRDKLRLEGVSRRWQRLLIESWKDVRVLDVSEIFSPSLTDENIECLRKRVENQFVKRLEFKRPREGYRFIKAKEEDEEEWVIARRIFSSLSSPPCAVKEVVLGDRMLDRSTLFSLTRIGDQITSLELQVQDRFWLRWKYGISPEEPIEDKEDGRSFFEFFPNLIRLKCMFPEVYGVGDGYNSKCWASLPSCIEYLHLDCWGPDDTLAEFFNVEEPLSSVRELELDGLSGKHTTTLSGLAARFPSLEILKIGADVNEVFGLEQLRSLKNLRELELSVNYLDFGFLSHALSFAFREKLETFYIFADPFGPFAQEYLENLSCFPNLKRLTLVILPRVRVELNVKGIEKIAKGCKKLQEIALGPCEEMNDESLGILAANCPDLRVLRIAGSHVTQEGIEACRITNPNLEVCLHERFEVETKSEDYETSESEDSETSESDDY